MAGRRNTIYASHSTMRSSQASSRFVSKRSVAFDSKVEKPSLTKKPSVQVFDNNNIDVTPRSLLGSDANSLSKSSSKSVINFNDSASVAAPSDLLNQSMFGGSTFQTSYAAGFSKSIMSSMISSKASLDSVTDEISEPIQPQTFALQEDIDQEHSDTREILSDGDLEKVINITLVETETICLLDIPDVSVSINSENINTIHQRNKDYEQLCANRHGNDRYLERGMQTFDNASKTKDMQTTPVETIDQACMATNWDLYDTYNKSEEIAECEDGDEDIMLYATDTTKKVGSSKSTSTNVTTSILSQTATGNLSSSVMSESSIFSTSSVAVEESEEGSVTAAVDVTAVQMEKLMKLDSFNDNLFIMERTVVQNQYHSRQAAYRGLSDLKLFYAVDNLLTVEEETQPIGPNISRLWSYECSYTRGMSATCMVWNKDNHDLLAIGYSKNGFAENGKGLVCVWSINNPEYPERMYVPSCAVTAVDFSISRPYLLSVGLFNGTIAIYNIHNSIDKPVLDSIDSIGKHSAPIWQLKWVEREKGTVEDRGEVLVSASGDGRVTQWSISKGFEFADLMKLKRTALQSTAKKTGGKKNDAFISRFTSGMCFDFHPNDGNIYLAGTEDGHIHRCSCSYNEQFLETYTGHKESVYRTVWSPFNTNIFLTCSADWSIRLWHVDKIHPILTFQSATQAVIDIDWCPMSPVIFAAINEQQVEIWDLTSSILDPLIVHLPVTHVKLTSVKFALNSKSLIVGDSDGHATIYQLKEMDLDENETNTESLLRVIESNLPEMSTKVPYDDDNNGTSKSVFVDR